LVRRSQRRAPHGRHDRWMSPVVWIEAWPSSFWTALRLSVASAFASDTPGRSEIRFGILLLARGRRRSRLERWFEEGVRRLQCIPWEASTGLRWAELLAALRAQGRAMPIEDSFIAATALAHELAVVTLNRRDFDAVGVPIVDPLAVPGE
jgi:predicted nucleic acid-binding protein